jgi:hypothetical protein
MTAMMSEYIKAMASIRSKGNSNESMILDYPG